MEKQLIHVLRFNKNTVVNLAEPVYIDVKGSQMKILMRVVVELNNRIKELKEQLNESI